MFKKGSVVVSRRMRGALFLPLLVLAGGVTLANGQEFRALILGRVTDPNGAVIAGAAITAKGPQQVYTVNTNASGDFTIPFVQPGTYDITAEAPGFKKEVRQGVIISVSQKINLNFMLQVGSVTEEVAVAAETPLLNTADASGGTVIDSDKVQNLPLNGRQIYTLLAAQPGVRFTANVGGVTGQSGTRGWDATNAYVINGVTTAYNQFTLNGAPISQQTSTAIGAWFIAPNVDAVQELKIMTNTYDASYGRAGGGTVNVITKNGTNSFHGTVFDFWKNSIMEANYFQLKQVGKDRPFHNQHQFGGTVGGPIRKSKTFFFFSYEGWREAFPAGVVTSTPAADVRRQPDGSVDFSTYVRQQNLTGIYDPLTCATTNADGTCRTRARFQWNGRLDVIPPNRVSPIGLKILSLYPLPNNPQAGQFNNYVGNTGGRYRYNQPMIRIDHNFSDRTRFYGMFSWWSGTEFRNTQGYSGPDVNPAVITGNINTYRSFLSQILDLTHAFSSTLYGDIRVSFGREIDLSPSGAVGAGTATLTPEDLGLRMPLPPTSNKRMAPQISVAGYPQIIGNRLYSDTGHPPMNEVFEVSPTMTKVIGHHNLRFGGQFLQVYAIPCCGNDSSGGYGPGGEFNFTAGFTQQDPTRSNRDGIALASLVLGFPSSGNVPFIYNVYEGYPYFGVYLQDDWKIRSNLTINLGLRWDAELSPDERDNRLNAGFCFTCKNPVSDRVTFPANNTLPNGATMVNPILGGFQFTGNGLAPYDTQWNHWQPRVGIAWGINGKTVLRGGFGVNYAFARELGGNTTWTQTTTFSQAGTTPAGCTPGGNTSCGSFNSGNPYPNGLVIPAGNSLGALSGAGNGQSFDQRSRKIPYVYQYSVGIQRELPGQFVIEASYVGTYAKQVRVGTQFNVLTPEQFAQCRATPQYCDQSVANPFYFQRVTGMPSSYAASSLGSLANVPVKMLMTPFPHFWNSLFDNTPPVGHTNYNSLQVRVDKRLSGGGPLIRGLNFRTSFTYSRTMEATSYLNNAAPSSTSSSGGLRDSKLAYVIAGTDRPLELAVASVWDLPIGRNGLIGSGASGILGAFINDWSLDLLFTHASGTPTTIPNGFLFNCPQNNQSYKPAHQTWTQWLYNESPGCFASFPAYTPTTVVPRSSKIRNPWAPQLAMAMAKKYAVKEGMFLQFRAEIFNLTNSPIFGAPSTGSPNAAIAPVGGVPRGEPGSFTGYGTTGSTQQNLPRQFQLSLKVLF